MAMPAGDRALYTGTAENPRKDSRKELHEATAWDRSRAFTEAMESHADDRSATRD